MKTAKTTVIALVLAAMTLTGCTSSPPAGEQASGNFHVTDVAGRTVSLKEQPKRIVFAEGREVFASSILNPDNPVDNVVALGNDLKTAAPSYQDKLEQARPQVKDLPRIGDIAKGDVTVENLLAQHPDVVVMTLDHKAAAEKTGLLAKMDQAHLKYVFTDFRQKPLENTTTSVKVVGKLMGKEQRAEEFARFYDGRVQEITKRAATADHQPKTLLWQAAGMNDCCATVKESNMGDLIKAAGGANLGDTLLSSPSGTVTAEKVVAEQPEHIIATGGAWAKDPNKPETLPHVEMGYYASKNNTETTKRGLLDTPGFDKLTGDLHAVYHQFYDSPMNLFALEQFAKWLHPELFADVDPVKDFHDFHQQWMPFEASGEFFS